MSTNNSDTYEELQVLFTTAKNGNQDAFNDLFVHYKDEVAVRIHPPKRFRSQYTIDDIINESFLKAVRSFHNVQNLDSFPRWLYVIMVHTLIDMLKKIDKSFPNWSSVIEYIDIEYLIASKMSPDILEILSQDSEFQFLQLIVDELPETEQLIVKTRFDLGMTFEEEAEFLRETDIPELQTINGKTVSRKLNVILASLKIKMQKHCGIFIPMGQFTTFLRSFGPELPQTVAPTIGTVILGGLKWLSSLIVLPLLGITALLVCGNRGIRSMLQQTNDIESRLWLIRRLFWGYCGVILLPVSLVLLHLLFDQILLIQLAPRLRTYIGSVSIFALLGVGACFYTVMSYCQYSKISKSPFGWSLPEVVIKKLSLKKLITNISVLIGLGIIAFVAYFSFCHTHINILPSRLAHKDIADFCFVLFFYLGYHSLTVLTFQKMVQECEITSPADFVERGRIKSIWYFTIASICVMVLPFILQVFDNHTISFFDRVTMSVFSLWWIAICFWNYVAGARWWPVIITLLLQQVILYIVAFM